MARMIPKINPELIENTGEKNAYELFRDKLPASWVVRWHYPYCFWENHRLREGEADFVILAPGKGMLVVEVKATQRGRIDDQGNWFRESSDKPDERLKESPLEQAARNKHQIAKVFAGKVYHAETFPGTRGHFAFYPNGRISGKVPVSDEPAIVLQFKDRENLEKKLNDIFRAWGSDHHGVQFTDTIMDMAVSELSKSLEAVPVLAGSSVEDEKTITELTRLQFEAFRGLLGNQRVHVKGAAGAGKTLLARWTLDHLVGNGSRVLLTCYNNVLAGWLRNIEGEDEKADIESFFQVCRRTIIKAGMPFHVPQGKEEAGEFWNKRAPELLCEALDRLSSEDFPRYDALIVDEGQDFHPDWWLGLQLLLTDPDHGRLCIFSDSDQAALFGRADSYPSGMISYEIRENCRNTRRIASYCGKMISRDPIISRFQPEGVSPVVEDPIPDVKERAKRLKAIYNELLAEGFRPSDIALLSPFSRNHPECSFGHLKKLSGLDLGGEETDLAAWNSGSCVWASTVRKFKGLEASCIVLVDAVLDGGSAQAIAESYVGSTRAKHYLVVVPKGNKGQN